MNLRTWLQSRLSRPSKPRHPVMKPRLQVEPLESRVVPDCELGAVELVRDINTNGVSSNPAELVEINGIVFFTANDGVNGQELWKSDGTAAGTVMVKDITPGSGSSSPHVLTRVGNTLFFNAAGGLWKSDGTEAGTVFVKAVAILNDFPGAAVSADVGGTLFFLSDVPHPNHELWKSDGTEAGTVLVATLPVTSSVLGFLTAVNGTLFFRGDGADGTGQELWKSDGTAAGTVLVKDINPGSSGSSPSELTNVGGTLYFRATTATNGIELWKSDGTASGTVLVKDIVAGSGNSFPAGLTNVGGTLFFAASDGVGSELWKSDGTAAGTVLVKDINPGSGGSSPGGLANVGGMLFFAASDGVSGTELWKSDGTAAGTVLVKEINLGSGNSSPSRITDVGGTAFFYSAFGGGLWKSDGTAAGTLEVRGFPNPAPDNFLAVGGTLFFTATPTFGSGVELWKSNGTAAGTVEVKDINEITLNSSPANFEVVGNTLFFSATSPAFIGTELWKSDGTAAGTVLVRDIFPFVSGSTPNSSLPSNLTAMGGTLFFTAQSRTPQNFDQGFELWRSNGTAASTILVRDIFSGSGSSSPANLTVVGSTLFFTATNGTNGIELWKSNGTAAGTVLVADIIPGSGSSNPSNLIAVGSTLFFTVSTSTNGTELWKSDGTAAGTVLVKDINLGTGSSSPSNMTNYGGTLFFSANNGTTGVELWKSDGTEAGTVLVRDIFTGIVNSNPANLTVVGSSLFFTAQSSANGTELWKSDGTLAGTVLVKDIQVGGPSSTPALLTNVGGTLFFTANNGINGTELWKSDGTAAGTVLVRDIRPGVTSTSIGSLTAVGNILFFSANDGVAGTELWRSDGTTAGTVLAQDIFEGASSSNPARLTNFNGTLFFRATTFDHGAELWRAIPGTGGTGADAGGPYTVAEGGTVVLDGSGNDGTVVWDLDGDGIFGETGTAAQRGNETGANPTFSAAGLDGPLTFTVSIQATDECGTGTATATVTIINVNPTVTADSAAVTANEGGTATNAGTFNDAGPDTVTITASVGTVTQNNTTRTWNWSLNAVDGPAEPVTVTITATDDDGAASNATFTYSISNVAPSISLNGAATVNEGAPYTLNLGAVTDPGPDTITSHTIHWGDGTSNTYSGSPANTTRTHTYADGPANHTYTVAITDEDGTFLAGSLSVLVLNVAPTIALSGAGSVNEGSPYTLDLGAITDPGTDTVTAYTIHWGDGTSNTFSGNPAGVSRTHTYADGPNSRTITVSLTDEDGTYLSAGTLNLVVDNVAPALAEATFAVLENSPNGTIVGTVTGTDPGTDTLTYSITGGTGATAFAVNPISGQITVIDSAQLDFETTPSFTLEVTVTDDDGATGTALVTVNLLNKASISGSVFVDTNQNGLYDANEMGIDCVHLELLDGSGAAVLDGHGNTVRAETIDGFYLFEDLDPGTYRVREVQPTGVTDGAEQLGSLGGSIVANDTMQLTLADIDAFDYDFAEIGQPVTRGDTAGIGFWQNSRGQALITAGGSALAQWLTANFGNVFGNALVGADGAAVAAFYKQQLFAQSGPKVDAQFMALALSTYFTSRCLAGDVATGYGFTVTDTGIGTRVVNVGSSGAAFGVANNTNLTIMQLLLATNSLTDTSSTIGGFARTYDRNGDGVIDDAEAQLRALANSVYAAINGLGGI